MTIEVNVPTFPESVSDGTLVTWHKQAGASVNEGEVIADIETDKVVFEINAPSSGVIEEILQPAGATVISGQLIARIGAATETQAIPAQRMSDEATALPPPPQPAEKILAPSARKLVAEHSLNPDQISGSGKGGRVLKEDVLQHMEQGIRHQSIVTPATAPSGERPQQRVPMTRLRQRIAERLVEAQRTAAILTTFNEINMQPVTDLRDRYRERFEKTHGVRLGFMSFFVKATVEALKRFPQVNASIDGNEMIYHGFFDIGIAVGSPRGLVVPILHDADTLSIAAIEAKIADYGARAKDGKLEIDEITGGTFSITNGGVFGSLLSTPILNPPQSAILGMHKIQKRPVVENDEIVIRPMMYLALSYDHRIIDGREAVQFLVTIKELIEDPARMLLEI